MCRFDPLFPSPIALISASPHLSGLRRAATLIRRTFVRGVSLGGIMLDTRGRDKGKSSRRLSVVGCQLKTWIPAFAGMTWVRHLRVVRIPRPRSGRGQALREGKISRLMVELVVVPLLALSRRILLASTVKITLTQHDSSDILSSSRSG